MLSFTEKTIKDQKTNLAENDKVTSKESVKLLIMYN